MSGGRSPRRKGDGIERELVELHGALGIYAERYPLSGASRFRGSGHDLDLYVYGRDEAPLVAEVKARKNGAGFAQLDGSVTTTRCFYGAIAPTPWCRTIAILVISSWYWWVNAGHRRRNMRSVKWKEQTCPLTMKMTLTTVTRVLLKLQTRRPVIQSASSSSRDVICWSGGSL